MDSALADILEVLQALVDGLTITWEELRALAAAKRRQRGRFTQRLFLEYIE